MSKVIFYFDNHPLMTKKKASYIKWCEIYSALEKGEHIHPESRALLKAKAATINSKNP